MFNTNFLKSSFRFWDGIKTMRVPKYKYFPHHGYVAFCGEQGSGKSLSCHRLIKDLIEAYPGLRIVSNIPIQYTEYILYQGASTIDKDSIENPDPDGQPHKGYILFLDEITNMFTSLDSKNISDEWFFLMNQLRKRETVLLSTCPILQRVPKPMREQLDTVCICSSPFGTFQVNRWYKANVDTMLEAEKIDDIMQGLRYLKTNFFFHSMNDYERYDTTALAGRTENYNDFKYRR